MAGWAACACDPGRDPAPQVLARVRALGLRSGEEVASTLTRFATVVPDEAWTEIDAC
jgi:hypothetical protein